MTDRESIIVFLYATRDKYYAQGYDDFGLALHFAARDIEAEEDLKAQLKKES